MTDSRHSRPLAPPDPLPEESLDWNHLRRLWPNRTHESSWLKDVICWLGFHRWHPVQVDVSTSTLSCTYCRWCTAIRVHRNAAKG